MRIRQTKLWPILLISKHLQFHLSMKTVQESLAIVMLWMSGMSILLDKESDWKIPRTWKPSSNWLVQRLNLIARSGKDFNRMKVDLCPPCGIKYNRLLKVRDPWTAQVTRANPRFGRPDGLETLAQGGKYYRWNEFCNCKSRLEYKFPVYSIGTKRYNEIRWRYFITNSLRNFSKWDSPSYSLTLCQ